jgi:hypothetical protein
VPQSRVIRTLRGSVAASVATFVALVSHVAGGGHVPGALGVLVPLLLSVFVCVLLSGRTLSLWRLSISVALSQLLFHGLFILGTTGSAAASTGPGAHSHSVELVMSSPGMSHGGPDGVWMWVAHGIAAVVTITALHRGETVVAGLLGFTGYVIARIERAFSGLVIASPRPAIKRSAAWFEHRPTPLGVYASVSLQRGPPALLGS